MQPVPDALLEGIASQPEDVGVWEVLTDYLLEQDAPGATLARCDLELFRGISNPDLLGALAEARARRPKLPDEPYGGFDAMWRCGYVVRLRLDTGLSVTRFEPLLTAPALRGLHHLVFSDVSWREGGGRPEAHLEISDRLSQLVSAATPFLRRFTLHLEDRLMALHPKEGTDVLETLTRALPKKVERVDLSLSELSSVEGLSALARRVKLLNLDGTRLIRLEEGALLDLLDSAPDCTFFLGGTGLSPRTLQHPRVQWLAPDVVGWLELDATGVIAPLTALTAHDGYECFSWRGIFGHVRRDLMGWSRIDGTLLEDGEQLMIDGTELRFRKR